MKVPADSLNPGDIIRYRETNVVILSDHEPAPNQFGLPWFRYLAQTGKRTGYISFGPGGTADRLNTVRNSR